MSSTTFNTIMFFLSFIVVGTVIASPIDLSTKRGTDLLMHTILKSMNIDPPNHYGYKSGTILSTDNISFANGMILVSIRLEPDCSEDSFCVAQICDMLIDQDESNNFVVDEPSKECRYDKKHPNYHNSL